MNIVINRTDAIGDVMLTMPLAKRLKKQFPESKVFFICSLLTAPLFDNHPYIDGCFSLDKNKSFLSKFYYILKVFRKLKPSMYFHVGGDQTPNIASWFYRIPYRGGLKSKWQSFVFLNKAVRQKRSIVEMHESEYNLSLLSQADKINVAEFSPSLSLTPEEIGLGEETLNNLFNEFSLPHKPYIIIHPGMTGHTLNWPSRNYGRVIKHLEVKFPNKYNFIVSYTPSDAKFIDEVKKYIMENEELAQKTLFFDGSLFGLRVYMSLVKMASLFIGPSTGTTHIANALGTKQVSIYSPIRVQSAFRWGPFIKKSKQVSILIPDVVCGEQFKCAGEDCPYYECMSKIEVDDVIKECELLLDDDED